MAKVINFPQARIKNPPTAPPARPVDRRMPEKQRVAPPRSLARRLFHGVHVVLWFVAVMLLPLWKWVVGLDLLVQFGRMLYYWHTPGVHAGAIFLLHCLGVIGLVIFVFKHPREP